MLVTLMPISHSHSFERRLKEGLDDDRAGMIEEHVGLPDFGRHLCNGGIDLRLIGDVGSSENSPAASILDLIDHRASGFFVAVDDADGRPLGSEKQRRRPAHAGRSA